MFRPTAGDEPRPAIVFIHSGAFTGGLRSEQDAMAEEFAARGYVTVTITYRLREGAWIWFNSPSDVAPRTRLDDDDHDLLTFAEAGERLRAEIAAAERQVRELSADGDERDLEKAYDLYRQGAEDGNLNCKCRLVRCLALGLGVKQDVPEALRQGADLDEDHYADQMDNYGARQELDMVRELLDGLKKETT